MSEVSQIIMPLVRNTAINFDVCSLAKYWLDGDWKLLLEVDDVWIDRNDQAEVQLFFAIAHLQGGDTEKGKMLLQRAIQLGCRHILAKQALLAASMEKLAGVIRIQDSEALLNDNSIGVNQRAKQLRAMVLNSAASIEGSVFSGAAKDFTTPDQLKNGFNDSVGKYGRVGILSGYYPGIRFNSQVNHRLYAHQHGYRYIFDGTPRFDKRTYMRKLEAVLEYLELFDWLFWIDDDAYFTDFSVPVERFIDLSPNSDFIVCKSPSTKEIFTKISSGQFLLKNTELSRSFIKDALSTDLREVQKWWRSDLGMFTKGDQDAMVYLLESSKKYSDPFFKILEHDYFNNRDFEFEKSLSEHFLVHFTGKNKHRDKALFCQRLHCNEFICPVNLIEELIVK